MGQELTAVTFIHNYIQFHFDCPATLNAYNPMTVRSHDKTGASADEEFGTLLVGQVGKVVREFEHELNDAFSIVFEDGSRISVSLRPDEFAGPEAYEVLLADNVIVVDSGD